MGEALVAAQSGVTTQVNEMERKEEMVKQGMVPVMATLATHELALKELEGKFGNWWEAQAGLEKQLQAV